MSKAITRPSTVDRQAPLPRSRLEHDFYRSALLKWGFDIGRDLAKRWRLCRPRMLWSEFLSTLTREDALFAIECVNLELKHDAEEEERHVRRGAE